MAIIKDGQMLPIQVIGDSMSKTEYTGAKNIINSPQKMKSRNNWGAGDLEARAGRGYKEQHM